MSRGLRYGSALALALGLAAALPVPAPLPPRPDRRRILRVWRHAGEVFAELVDGAHRLQLHTSAGEVLVRYPSGWAGEPLSEVERLALLEEVRAEWLPAYDAAERERGATP